MTMLSAGRELDALVAQRVMGETVISGILRSHPDWQYVTLADGVTPFDHLHAYSTDIAAAWLVVEKMHDDGWNSSVAVDNRYGCTFYKVNVHGDEKFNATWETSHGPINAATAPLSICLAALKAVGAEVPA